MPAALVSPVCSLELLPLVQALNVPTAALVFSVLSGYLFKQYNCLRLGQYNKVNALPGWGLAPPHLVPRGMPLAQQKCWWASKCLWGDTPRPDTGPDSLHHPVIPAIEPTASCFCHQLAPYYCMGQALGLRGTTALCSFSVMPYSLLCLVGFAFLRKCPRESSPINIAPIFFLSLQCGEDSQCKVGKAGGGKSWRTYVTFPTAVMPSGKCLLTPHLPCTLRETKRHNLGCTKKGSYGTNCFAGIPGSTAIPSGLSKTNVYDPKRRRSLAVFRKDAVPKGLVESSRKNFLFLG